MKLFYCLASLLLLTLSAAAGRADDGEGFNAWKESFKQEALQEGISASFLNKVLPEIKFLPFVVQADRKQPEFRQTFDEYLVKRLTAARVKKGRLLLKENKVLLDSLTQKYGVPAQYIIALWGLETNYGSYTGSTDIASALATLTYEGRRAAFFKKQLLAYLKMLQAQNAVSHKGSWAGAFGQFQFMPTTYAAYAVDGNENGTIDIINEKEDAFASAANYLAKAGWKSGTKWGREIMIPAGYDWTKMGSSLTYTLEGFAKTTGLLSEEVVSTLPEKIREMKAVLIFPNGYANKAYLVYPNFYTIKRWNNSNFYALAVGLLADAVASDEDFEEPEAVKPLPENSPFSKEDLLKMQSYLKELSYYKGAVDGAWGPLTMRALDAYQKKEGLPIEMYLYMMNLKNGENS